MPRRPDIRPLRLAHGKTQRVGDDTLGHLSIAHQAGQDREPGRVSAGPTGGAQQMRAQVIDRARARPPGAIRLGPRMVEFIQLARVAVNDQDMAVAVDGSILDGGELVQTVPPDAEIYLVPPIGGGSTELSGKIQLRASHRGARFA